VQVVGLCNTYTCHLLLSAALATRTSTFEEMCEAVGGRSFKVFAQLSNVILLAGNLTGDMCLLADLGFKSLTATLGEQAPQLLTSHKGRGIMLLLTAVVIIPVSMCKGMRGLELVSSGGLVILATLFAVLTFDAVTGGFQGITSGQVPMWWLPSQSSSVSEAFALLGAQALIIMLTDCVNLGLYVCSSASQATCMACTGAATLELMDLTP
jgi:Transmembrane amino acid transporter protein